MVLKIVHENGLKITNSTFEFSVDPLRYRETSDINFITHAHKDHVNITNKTRDKNYIVTNTSAEVMKTYFGDFNYDTISYKNKMKLGGVAFEFKNSGHVAGSYALNIYDDQKVTITGDINNVDTILTKAIEPEETDILIVESTFGREHSNFPDRIKSYEEFMKWLTLSIINNRMPTVFAYSFGKAQEIIGLINQSFDFNIGLNESAYNITKAHEKTGIKLKNYHKINGNLKDMDVLILPSSRINRETIQALEYGTKKSLTFASVTGQDFSFGKHFKISDHADCQGLLNYVRDCNPKKVYTYHGYKEELANLIEKRLKINAEPLTELVI